MTQSRRDESETPVAEPRPFTDDRGRRWSGVVVSGRFRGGEEHAEVVFVCEDVPSEEKRFVRLDRGPVEAAEELRRMGEPELRELFRGSERV